MKSLENRFYIFLRVVPILFVGIIAFDFILYFYFDENPELTVKVIALSLAISALLTPLMFLAFHHDTKKLREFGERLKESIERREFCINTTKIAELDMIADEVNKLLDVFYKNTKLLRTHQESSDKTTKDLKQKMMQYESIINTQMHGIAIFKDGMLDFANSFLLKTLGLPSINEFHKNRYRLLDYFERTGEHRFFDGYQDDSWCFALVKEKEPQKIKIAGTEYRLDATKLSSDDTIVMINFIKEDARL